MLSHYKKDKIIFKKVWTFPFSVVSCCDRLAKLILRHDAALKATMNESEIELFGKFKDAVTELNCLNECEGFINGFRLGIRLMVEALHTEE